MRFKGTHYEVGFKRGTLFKKYHVTFPINLDQFQLQYGKKAGQKLAKCFPEAYEEVKGITDALEINHEKFLSWMMCMGCCMYHLEENIPEIRGCSAFAFTHQGNTYYGRNNDLPVFLKKTSKAEIYNLNQTPKIYMTTSSFVNGEEGLNEHGLAVAMTFVTTRIQDLKPGLNSVFIVRYLLEKAKNTIEAIEKLHQIPIASNCNILLADRFGDIVVVEASPSKLNIRKPNINEIGNKYIATTNEFTTDMMKPLECQSETYLSTLRYEVVIQALRTIQESDCPIEYIQDILKGKHGFICQYDKKDHFETIWSSIFDINHLVIKRAEGDPRKAKFRFDNRLQRL